MSAITQAVTKLFKDRMIDAYCSKHFEERIIQRNIPLAELSKALNKIADNVCLIRYLQIVNARSVKVEFDSFVLAVSFGVKGQLQIVTVFKPRWDNDTDLVLK
jgi:hypothetical protein